MGILTMVRHGQARAFEKDSDRLTETGEQQARILARSWIDQRHTLDEVYSGTLVRQRRTAEIVESTYRDAGFDWPGIESTPEFNEYDAGGLLTVLAPELSARDTRFKKLASEFDENRNAPDRNRYFQSMFETLTTVWLSGELELDGLESWREFRSRVTTAISRIVNAEGKGKRIAVFTSGGVIGLTVQSVLASPEPKALEINWRIRNCSITDFIFSRGRVSLDSFNSTNHLESAGLITYR